MSDVRTYVINSRLKCWHTLQKHGYNRFAVSSSLSTLVCEFIEGRESHTSSFLREIISLTLTERQQLEELIHTAEAIEATDREMIMLA